MSCEFIEKNEHWIDLFKLDTLHNKILLKVFHAKTTYTVNLCYINRASAVLLDSVRLHRVKNTKFMDFYHLCGKLAEARVISGLWSKYCFFTDQLPRSGVTDLRKITRYVCFSISNIVHVETLVGWCHIALRIHQILCFLSFLL